MASNIAQVTGLELTALISKITTAAKKTTTHQTNCQQLANHVTLIGNLLDKLKTTSDDLWTFPATREPLELLEDSLGRALDLVECCGEKSYLYMLAMGWTVVYQFRQVQIDIDRYLKLLPLISLVHEYRMQNIKESLEAIDGDHSQYTLDEEDVEAQGVVLKRDRTKKDAKVLEESLSRRYPELAFREALQEEKEKLQIELKRSRVSNDPQQCTVIEHLIDVTENVVNVPKEKLLIDAQTIIGNGNKATSKSSNPSNSLQPQDIEKSEWQADLFGCYKEPCLTREQALNDLRVYSLFCACCCYTCCVRRKLRELFNIEGGSCDDFLTHLMCCCCAMVQEWRELELQGFDGRHLTLPAVMLPGEKNGSTTVSIYEALT
ncbi:PLAC8 motif-containing protein, partial [Dillenia turbinata]